MAAWVLNEQFFPPQMTPNELVRKDLLNQNLDLPTAYYTGAGALTDLYVNVLNIACQLREILDHRNDIEAK